MASELAAFVEKEIRIKELGREGSSHAESAPLRGRRGVFQLEQRTPEERRRLRRNVFIVGCLFAIVLLWVWLAHHASSGRKRAGHSASGPETSVGGSKSAGTGPTPDCMDVADWMDSHRRGCSVYEAQQLCTFHGAVGPGWVSDAASPRLSDAADERGVAADMACCACGGGYLAADKAACDASCNGAECEFDASLESGRYVCDLSPMLASITLKLEEGEKNTALKVTGTTTGASPVIDKDCNKCADSETVVYKIRSEVKLESAFFTTCDENTNFDTVLWFSAGNSDCGTFNDDDKDVIQPVCGDMSYASTLKRVGLTEGVDYFLNMCGHEGADGQFTLVIIPHAEGCADKARETFGYSCKTWGLSKFCTFDGDYGEGFRGPKYKVPFDQLEDSKGISPSVACCVCGGGMMVD